MHSGTPNSLAAELSLRFLLEKGGGNKVVVTVVKWGREREEAAICSSDAIED